jgi:microcystin-dependent protein
MGQGNGQGLTPRSIGETAGEENHTLMASETPVHTHTLDVVANNTVSTNTNTPGGTVVLAQTTGKKSDGSSLAINIYSNDPNPNQTMAPAAIGSTGGQPHSNLMPYLALNVCIALTGIFPSRN